MSADRVGHRRGTGWHPAAIAALIVAAGLGALACEEIVAPRNYVTSVVLRLPHDSLFVGKSIRATVVATGDSAFVAAPQFRWTSSDTTVAVVDSTGMILAVGLGSTTITAELKEQRDEFRIRTTLRRADGGIAFEIGSPSQSGGSACAISTGAEVYCAPSSLDSIVQFSRMPRTEAATLTSVQTGFGNVCGRDATGVIYCWGDNFDFILATRVPTRMDTAPLPVNTERRFAHMSAGGHTNICAIEETSDIVYCWGHGHVNALGRESATPSPSADSMVSPVTGSLRARRVAVGSSGACALDLDGKPHCWGNASASFGTEPPTAFPPQPRPVISDIGFASLAVATEHACALTSDGVAYCWGRNRSGQLGLGNANDVPPGTHRVHGKLRFASIYAFESDGSCGITAEGDLYCWGNVAPYAVTQRKGSRRNVPTPLMSGLKFRALTAGLDYICGITLDRRILCW